MKTILKISVFLILFFNSCLLLSNNHQEVKPFKFDLPLDADLDRLPNDLDDDLDKNSYAIFIEDDIIWVNTEQSSAIPIIDPLIKAEHFSKDTSIKIDLKSNLSSFLGYQIEFEERDNLEIFFLMPIDKKDGLYELFVRYKFNNQVIRFKGKNLSKQGLETFLLIKKTIDYSNDVQILNIVKTECGEQNYSEDSLSRFGFQILDIKHQSELLTFKLVEKFNCCVQLDFNYQLRALRKTLFLTRKTPSNNSSLYSVYFNHKKNEWSIQVDGIPEEECECDCAFCYTFEIKTKEKFNHIIFQKR